MAGRCAIASVRQAGIRPRRPVCGRGRTARRGRPATVSCPARGPDAAGRAGPLRAGVPAARRDGADL